MLPTNGSILIIDDRIDECLPLMRALSNNSTPFLYHTGDDISKSLNYKGIRIVFLDIMLGTTGSNDKTVTGKVANVLTKLISKDNGPYFVIAWTRHEEYVTKIKTYLDEAEIPPLEILSLDKNTCLGSGDEESNDSTGIIKRINKAIIEQLKKIRSFQAILHWEKCIKTSTVNTIQLFQKSIPENDDWDKDLLSIFYALAKAKKGKQVKKDDKVFIHDSLNALNLIFNDSLENEIKLINLPDNDFSNVENNIDDRLSAEINSKFLTTHPIPESNIPGSIIALKKRTIKEKLYLDLLDKEKVLNEFFEKTKIKRPNGQDKQDRQKKIEAIVKSNQKTYDNIENSIRKSILLSTILINFTPQCDFAQDKIGLCQMVAGTIINVKYAKYLKKSDSIYESPIIIYNKQASRFYIDMKFVTGLLKEEYEKENIILQIRNQFLIDLQSHISNHINRPGLIAVDKIK